MRALLVGMEKWVRQGVAPPPSRYPRLQDGNLVRSTDVAFPNLPRRDLASKVLAGARGVNSLVAKDGGAGTPLPLLVSQVDKDGNELGGLRLPDVMVPLATSAGWNFPEGRDRRHAPPVSAPRFACSVRQHEGRTRAHPRSAPVN